MKVESSPKSAKGTPNGSKKNKTPLKVQNPQMPVAKELNVKGKSQTPQPKKSTSTPISKKGKDKKTPKSEPQIKTKKLKDEIDEELSDEDFEVGHCENVCLRKLHYLCDRGRSIRGRGVEKFSKFLESSLIVMSLFVCRNFWLKWLKQRN